MQVAAMSRIVELYGTITTSNADWPKILADEQCPFLKRKCLKNRKSAPELTIGSCTLAVGKNRTQVIVCPFRLLEGNQVFLDCIHLLSLHEPGNELHVIPQLSVPGGSIDYCLVSVRNGKPVDFVGIEFQTLDTTGTVWPERQRFAHQHGRAVKVADRKSDKSFGVNWKMTAKTTLVQLHHKIVTFEHINRHLVLVAQDDLIAYMKKQFSFDHLQRARLGDPMHFHAYTLQQADDDSLRLQLQERLSTDGQGVARCLGIQSEANVEIAVIFHQLEAKISAKTRLSIEAADARLSPDR